jgi:hypothetical protein
MYRRCSRAKASPSECQSSRVRSLPGETDPVRIDLDSLDLDSLSAP